MSLSEKDPQSPHEPGAYPAWGAIVGALIGAILGAFIGKWVLVAGMLGIIGWLVGAFIERSRS